MQAIRIHAAGDARSLSLDSVDVPQIQHDSQVLVRLQAAGVNPLDTKIRSNPGAFPIDLPYIPGCDGAGIIEAVGAAVTNFKAGDDVFYCQCGFHGVQGSYAEYAVVEQRYLAHKPADMPFAEAAATPLVLITAWEALFDRLRLQPGQTILIHAGAGGVGHIAIQLAKQLGCKVATTVSSTAKSDFVRFLGADLVINYKEQDVCTAVLEWSRDGVDAVFDTVGGKVLEQSFACVRPYGDIVSILQPAADTNWKEARLRNLRFGFELMLTPAMLNLPAEQARHGLILAKTLPMFARKDLRIVVGDTLPLADASAAHELLEQQPPNGKLVLTID